MCGRAKQGRIDEDKLKIVFLDIFNAALKIKYAPPLKYIAGLACDPVLYEAQSSWFLIITFVIEIVDTMQCVF